MSGVRLKFNANPHKNLNPSYSSADCLSRATVYKARKQMVSVDMDGTIADISRRRILALESGPDKSHEFYNALLDGSRYHMDEPIIASRDFLHAYVAQTGGEIVYLSGRRQGTEHNSEEWLRAHNFPSGRILHRALGQRSLNFKLNWLRQLMKEGAWIDAHFGDRIEDDGGAAKAAGIRFVYIENNIWPIFPSYDLQ